MTATLTQPQIKQLKAVLDTRRDELRQELLAEHEDTEESGGHEVRHGGEEYFATLLKDVGGELADLRVKELADIDAALQLIENGHYGTCIDCETSIGFARLEAFPRAKRCVSCKEELERKS